MYKNVSVTGTRKSMSLQLYHRGLQKALHRSYMSVKSPVPFALFECKIHKRLTHFSFTSVLLNHIQKVTNHRKQISLLKNFHTQARIAFPSTMPTSPKQSMCKQNAAAQDTHIFMRMPNFSLSFTILHLFWL